ncbi:hypothetical protein [Embleya sp. MST-111070]
MLGSDDPERLSDWYRAAFAPSATPGAVLMVGDGRRAPASRAGS